MAIEDLLYEPRQKFFKIIFILIVPIAGAITELYLLSRYAQYKESGGHNDAQWYEFWDHYSNAHNPSQGNGTDDSSGYDGGGDGGSGGGGD